MVVGSDNFHGLIVLFSVMPVVGGFSAGFVSQSGGSFAHETFLDALRLPEAFAYEARRFTLE